MTNLKGKHVFLLSAAILALAGCDTLPPPPSAAPSAPEERHEFTQPQMGVPFRLVIYATNGTAASNAARAAFERIAQLNASMSDYDTDSELNRLSRSSGQNLAIKVSPDLWRILEYSQRFAEETKGAFDVTVGPFVSLWRKARRTQKFPATVMLAQAQRAVGYQHVRLDKANETVTLLAPDMRLDLGGIAKGYAVEEALKVLRTNGIRRALVAGAGDLAVLDPPPGTNSWRIEVPPLEESGTNRFVQLRNQALATSGDLFQHVVIENKRYSHIVDPRTGVGLTDHSLVTVIAKSCTVADALATAISVLGPTEGLRMAKAHNAEVRILRKPQGRLESYETPGFKRFEE